MTMLTAALPGQPPTPGTAPPRVTPDEMLRLADDGKLYELVDGQLVEKPVSDLAHLVANNLNDELVVWSRRTNGGRSFVEATYRCFAQAPEMVRRPDVSYVARERLVGYRWNHAHLEVVPDLVAEVVSPTDVVYDLDRKIHEYFTAGVSRVWVLNPDRRIARVHRAPGDVSELVGNADLTDDIVLPGFRCPLPSLFNAPGNEFPTAAPLPPQRTPL